MSALAIRAADINDEKSTLEITWNDGHTSVYPLRYVRENCPCASCRQEREERKNNPFRVIGPNQRPPSFQIINVEPIGRYGMKLIWKDAHATGIYTFDYLRQICPCEECTAQRQPDNKPWVHGIYIPR